MRLLVDARVGWRHGIGRVMANTIPLIAARHAGWQIDALVEPADIGVAEAAFGASANIAVVPCSVSPFSLAEQVRLQAYVRGHDLTWFTNYWVPLGWRSPFVATVHDLLHLIPEFFPASRSKRLLSRRTFAKIRRDARAIIFVSRFTEQAFGRTIGEPGRGVVVPLGGDHLGYSESMPLRSRSRRLMVVAASKKHKNFALLLKAWERARVPEHWTLTIVSPDDPLLRSSIDLVGMAERTGNVELHRGTSNEKLAALYGDSAILLMPSLYEGFGLPLLEGMLAGALCVSSNAGAMVEVAQGAFVQFVNGTDQAGWTAAIEQTCAMVDGDRIDIDMLTAHNVACAGRFRWDTTAREIAAVLQAAVH